MLSRELVSSLQFYQTRSESLDIGSILLSGGGAELTGFATELERLIGVPVRTGDPLVRVELARKVARPAEPGLSRHRHRARDRGLMRAVNLLPKDEPRSSRGLPSPWVLLAATVPVVAGSLVYLGYSSEQAKVSDKRAELVVVQAQIAKLSGAQAGLKAQSALVGLRATRQTALADALAKSMPWDVTLGDLARVLPTGVSLTSLNALSPTPAASSAATSAATASASAGFSLQGVAQNHDQVAELLERLSLLPMLSDVTLGMTSTVQSDKGPGQLAFQVTAAVHPPPTGGAS